MCACWIWKGKSTWNMNSPHKRVRFLLSLVILAEVRNLLGFLLFFLFFFFFVSIFLLLNFFLPFFLLFFFSSFFGKVQPHLVTTVLTWPKVQVWRETLSSVQGSPAVLRATETRDFYILNWKLVVVGNFLVHIDVLLGVDNDLLLRLHRDHFSITIWLQGWQNRWWCWFLRATASQPPHNHSKIK